MPELHDWIKRVMDENKFSYEIIFVDDGKDKSWQVIESIAATNHYVKAIKFRRNYGKSPRLVLSCMHVLVLMLAAPDEERLNQVNHYGLETKTF